MRLSVNWFWQFLLGKYLGIQWSDILCCSTCTTLVTSASQCSSCRGPRNTAHLTQQKNGSVFAAWRRLEAGERRKGHWHTTHRAGVCPWSSAKKWKDWKPSLQVRRPNPLRLGMDGIVCTGGDIPLKLVSGCQDERIQVRMDCKIWVGLHQDFQLG